MKKYSPITYVLAGIVVFAVATMIVMNIRAVRAQKTPAQDNTQGNANDDHKEVKEALRRGGYREVAKIKKHYVSNFNPHWDWSSFDMEALTKNSVAVIVGSPTQSKSQLTPNGQLITTEYEVSVQEVIKGKIAQGDTIKISLPGGKVEFEDGTSVELKTPDFEKMTTYNSYVLFLYANRNGSDVFLLTGGPQGLFELPPNGMDVKPHGRPTDPAVKEAKGKNVQAFLEEIRKQAVKWPEPGNCCK
jgi:flagellar biosynthesis/type III secretory pathway M-ring protein FliF/YscJ